MNRTALVVVMIASAACASTGSSAEAPMQVPTFVGNANRLTDEGDSQHWPSPPAGVHEPVSRSFEICVDRQGVVSSVQAKGPVDARVDTDWVTKMKSWKHAVHKVDGRAVPYCYPIRLQVRADGAGGSARVEQIELVLIAPDVGLAHRLTNVDESAYRPSLPADLDVPGAVYWGVFKICVERDGVVSGAKVIKSPDNDRLVPLWIATMKLWRYRPFEQYGRAVPFCHPIRLEVRGGAHQ
jgi:hypothetical protein